MTGRGPHLTKALYSGQAWPVYDRGFLRARHCVTAFLVSMLKATTCIEALDDACLTRIFAFLSPLPDLFNVSRVCQRFNTLMVDGRMALLVAPGPTARQFLTSPHKAGGTSSSGRRCRSVHCNLAAAVAISRPGDTILIEPGLYEESEPVVLAWPLRLVGAGSTGHEGIVITSLQPSRPVLDVRASAKLMGLSLHGGQGPCVLHAQGSLLIQGCLLHSCGQGLEHLLTPLVTTACSKRSGSASCAQLPMQASSAAPPTPGRLIVSDTSIQGCSGSQAVHTLGTGRLRHVRVAHHRRSTRFWFEVDSAHPGTFQQLPQPAWLRGMGPPTPLRPAKARRVLSSDGRALIRQESREEGAGASGGCGGEGPALAGTGLKDALQAKARAWNSCGRLDAKPEA